MSLLPDLQGSAKTRLSQNSRVESFGVRIATWTTRPARPGETNGNPYLFVSEQQFERAKLESMMFDEASIGEYRYGASLGPIIDAIRSGSNALIQLTSSGCFKLKAILPCTQVVLLVPANRAQLISQIQHRGAVKADALSRLNSDPTEWNRYLDFDFVVMCSPGEISAAATRLIDWCERRARTAWATARTMNQIWSLNRLFSVRPSPLMTGIDPIPP